MREVKDIIYWFLTRSIFIFLMFSYLRSENKVSGCFFIPILLYCGICMLTRMACLRNIRMRFADLAMFVLDLIPSIALMTLVEPCFKVVTEVFISSYYFTMYLKLLFRKMSVGDWK